MTYNLKTEALIKHTIIAGTMLSVVTGYQPAIAGEVKSDNSSKEQTSTFLIDNDVTDRIFELQSHGSRFKRTIDLIKQHAEKPQWAWEDDCREDSPLRVAADQ